jgi:predicted RND superfamily exporter protein
MGNILLVLLIIAAVIATVVALIRGIIAFLRTTEAELNDQQAGPSQSSLKQNKMMLARITFQGVAVLLVALALLVYGGGR